MRIGFISDVHNDVQSLRHSLKVLEGCDRIFHLGDIVEDGDEANDIVAILVEHDIDGVRGIHDEMAMRTASYLSNSTIEYLTALPERLEVEGMLLVHDNPLSKAKGEGLWHRGGYIKNEDSAQMVFEESEDKIIIVGHTHLATQYRWNGSVVETIESSELVIEDGLRYILNPGPVKSTGWQPPSVGIIDRSDNTFTVSPLITC
jgi:predicted phosphodiesterase